MVLIVTRIINNLIYTVDFKKRMSTEIQELLDTSSWLHGHYCPGLALGVKASAIALEKLELEHEGMEDVFVIVETNNCFSDGVQYVTGCTFGNNSLIFRDFGKTAATFVKRGAKGLRITTKANVSENWNDQFPEYRKLFEKVVKQRKGTEEDKKKMLEIAKKISHMVITIDPELLFDMEFIDVDIPRYAPIHESYTCSKCGENVMSTRTVKREGKIFCLVCVGEEYFELDGHGIHIRGGKE